MWLSSRLIRNALVALVFLAPAAALSGCTGFTPVYGENGLGAERVELSYAAPNSRLEQVIYQALALRLGKSSDPDAPRVSISASNAARALTSDIVTVPNRQLEMVVTAAVTLTDKTGKVLFSGIRKASASYTSGAQLLANQAAETDATERAGKTVAETIRLTLLGALLTPAKDQ